MLRLSGDQRGEPQPSRLVNFRGYEPSGSLIQISMLPPRLDIKANLRPLGETCGPSLSPAAEITTMMEGVVSSNIGTGQQARIPGINVAGKTGTAQTAPGQPDDAWFVAFAPSSGSAGGPQVAVAVVVEGAPNQQDVWGGKLAAPVAKAVIQAVMSR